MKTICLKCEEINERAKIEDDGNKENEIYEISQFIFDIFNENMEAFGFMKNYHQNLGKGLGIKIGIMKGMFQNPKLKNENNKFKKDNKFSNDKNDFINSDIIKDSFMCDYKLWMENINNINKSEFKFKPNVFKIILFNLLNNENNINVDIALVIANNYFLWTIIHKLNMPKKILGYFDLQISPKINNNIINNNSKTLETPENPNIIKEEDNKYKQFVFDEKYIINNLNTKENENYKTNNILIEKLCLNLENKILLSKIELIYVELICKNINDLCVEISPNNEKQISTLKTTAINLIKLLENFLQIPNSGYIEENSSYEELVCLSMEKVANNLNDESYFNKQLNNLPRLMEVIAEYEINKNEIKGNLVKNMTLSAIYLLTIIERLTKKHINSPFKCLHKNIQYNINEILEEKCDNSDKKRFTILYEQKSKIVFYDDLFLYHCYLTNGRDSKVEMHDIIFIKNLNESKNNINDKLTFKINNEIFINFNHDKEGEEELNNFEDKYKKMKENTTKFSSFFDRFNLKNILKYAIDL